MQKGIFESGKKLRVAAFAVSVQPKENKSRVIKHKWHSLKK